MSRRPCLAEEWFVEDGLEALPSMGAGRIILDAFDPDPAKALSEVFRLSRAIRVKRIEARDVLAARQTDDWEAFKVMGMIYGMLLAAERLRAAR